jgi:hypothetical protein
MTEIKKFKDCGNSPRNRTLQDLAIAIALADVYLISQLVTDDVLWRPIGSKPVSGSDTVCRGLARHGQVKVITIEHAISHGRTGAINGEVQFGRKRRAFCLVVEFVSAKGSKVREITSYSVALPPHNNPLSAKDMASSSPMTK